MKDIIFKATILKEEFEKLRTVDLYILIRLFIQIDTFSFTRFFKRLTIGC